MPVPEQRRELIASIRDLPALVADLVDGLTDAQLDVPGDGGEWSIRQLVHHLADAHINGFVRMKLVLTEEKPTLKTYEQDEWARLPDSTVAPIEPSLSILRGLHARWCDLLETLPEESWRRSAIHPETGEVTLDDLLVTYARHGQSHVEQIGRIQAGLGR